MYFVEKMYTSQLDIYLGVELLDFFKKYHLFPKEIYDGFLKSHR